MSVILIIITICLLLLVSYLFDITASKSRIPSVLLLLITGMFLNYISPLINIRILGIDVVLPVLGNIGLILIVLEGVMEIEISREKQSLIFKSLLISLLQLIIFTLVFSLILSFATNKPLYIFYLNAVPLAVISSAIVIPSVRYKEKKLREFAIYESSMSDIFGILLFNIINQSMISEISLIFDTIVPISIVLAVSLIATLFLSRLLHSIEHPIKFTPIILMIILIYSILKYYHMPALIFILVFGLILNNLHLLKGTRAERIIDIEKIYSEIPRFRDIVCEGTFLIRSLFFIVFGYSLNISDIFSLSAIPITIIVLILIYAIRFFLLKIFDLPIGNLISLVPRGLITILLFLSIDPSFRVEIINNSVVVQVIVITILVMTYGNLFQFTGKENSYT